MDNSNFIDYAKIFAKAGKGGAGSHHLRTEKFAPKGGPDGGDGGRGGSVIVKCNSQLSTLMHFRYRKHMIAEDGKPGSRSCSFGAAGADVIMEVPLGTVFKCAETDRVILEVTEKNSTQVLMKGGRGGQGNTHFKSPTNQCPRYAQPGEFGAESWVIMELKLLADVGLVGLPNAGKSTLLSSVSAAKPKIDSYPFTTLVPHLGVVSYGDDKSFVMADIPGIIEGAAAGKGLGTRFLRHIERNSALMFVVSADTPCINETYELLIKELQEHNPELLDKPRLLVVSKIDLLNEKELKAIESTLPKNIDNVFISAMTGNGINAMKRKIWGLLHSSEAVDPAANA